MNVFMMLKLWFSFIYFPSNYYLLLKNHFYDEILQMNKNVLNASDQMNQSLTT